MSYQFCVKGFLLHAMSVGVGIITILWFDKTRTKQSHICFCTDTEIYQWTWYIKYMLDKNELENFPLKTPNNFPKSLTQNSYSQQRLV